MSTSHVAVVFCWTFHESKSINLVWRLHGVELQAREIMVCILTGRQRSVIAASHGQNLGGWEQSLADDVSQCSCSCCGRTPASPFKKHPQSPRQVSWVRACCRGHRVNITVPTSGARRATPRRLPTPGTWQRPETGDGPGAGLEVRWLCCQEAFLCAVASSSPVPKRVRLRFGCCGRVPNERARPG